MLQFSHALVTTMVMMNHDEVKDASTPMMQACPVYLPVLQRIIAQEQPMSACRSTNPFHFLDLGGFMIFHKTPQKLQE